MTRHLPNAGSALWLALTIGTALSQAVAAADSDGNALAPAGRLAGEVAVPSAKHDSWRPQLANTDARLRDSTSSADRPVTLLELPSEWRPGSPSRPHHALGFRSSMAEGWLRAHGIDAKTCYLPMLRMPARVGPAGDASVALWIYARCSFY